jgi:hypothetical protein
MTGDEPHSLEQRTPVNSDRVRTLTVWLRPEFVLRVVMIVTSAVASQLGGKATSLGIVGFLFLIVAALSFTRGVQRLFEQTWELTAALLATPLTAVFLVWSGGSSAPSASRARTCCRSPSSDRRCSRCTRLARQCMSHISSTRTRPATA